MSAAYLVEGTVAPGYESVKEMFQDQLSLGSEENSQLCVYVQGEKVVDLWCKVDPASKFDADSLTNVYSSTKSLTAIMMGMAVDQGWLNYTDKISQHWSEFGQAGKEDITISDLLRHEAGLASLSEPLDIEDVLPENVKKNQAGEKLAKQQPTWPEVGKREYHAVTRGWIANEIFRRVNPDNLTLGEYLDKEIASKLKADLYIGCSKENFYDCKHAPAGYTIKESLKKSFGMKSGVESPFYHLLKLGVASARMKKANVGLEKLDPLDFNKPSFRSSECPSANGNCSARGLALLGSLMAHKGQLGETKLMSESSWSAMHAEPTDGVLFLNITCPFTQGGVAEFREESGRDGYYGWMGYGGSAFQWHPELKIGFGYTCTLLFPISLMNAKAARFQTEVARCAKSLQK